jgi:hypothetical protein
MTALLSLAAVAAVLFAAAVLLGRHYYGPKNVVIKVTADSMAPVSWSADDSDGPKQSGVTNLPATFSFRSVQWLDFTVIPSNAVAFMRVEITRDGKPSGNAIHTGTNALRLRYSHSEWKLLSSP